MSKDIERLWKIGAKSNVMQIVPPKGAVRPTVLTASEAESPELVARPLATPTGPGAAKGFRNRAGSTIQRPQVMNIYLGEFWGDKAFFEAFSKAIVENGYLDPLRELGYGTGSGVYLGSTNMPALTTKTFSDADARSVLKQMLEDGTIHGDGNSLFMLILPDKVTSTMSDGAKSCRDYCGYHDVLPFNGVNIAFGVMPSPLCKGCNGGIIDFTAIYAHQLAEACTDTAPGKGWVTDDGQENADLEAWVLFGWGPPSNPDLYTVQGYYTNERGNTIGRWRSPKFAAPKFVAPKLAEADGVIDFQAIVVRNTPDRGNFTGPSQQLKDLGILSSLEAKIHRSKIAQDIQNEELTIDEDVIESGPGVTVADCRDSVENNAH